MFLFEYRSFKYFVYFLQEAAGRCCQTSGHENLQDQPYNYFVFLVDMFRKILVVHYLIKIAMAILSFQYIG